MPTLLATFLKNDEECFGYVENAEALDKGIPDIHARTIDFLIKRGFCLCGNHIEVGNDAFNELNKLRDYIPPKSVGNLISEFTATCEEKTKSTETFSDSFNTNVRDIFSYEDTKADLEDDLLKINERLKGLEDVGSLAKDLMSYEKNIRDYKEERDEQNQILGAKRDALKINLKKEPVCPKGVRLIAKLKLIEPMPSTSTTLLMRNIAIKKRKPGKN